MSNETSELGAWSTPLQLSSDATAAAEKPFTTFHSPVYKELLTIRQERSKLQAKNTTAPPSSHSSTVLVEANPEAAYHAQENQVEFLTDTQQQSDLSLSIHKKIVIDSGAIIHSAKLEKYGSEFYTTYSVLSEIKSSKSRQKLMLFPFEIKVRQPSDDSLRVVASYSKKTGDYASLSKTDLDVLALTYEMEVEANGMKNIKPEPPNLGITGYKKVQLTPYTELLEEMYGAEHYHKSEVYEESDDDNDEKQQDSQQNDKHTDENNNSNESDEWETPKKVVKNIRKGADGKKIQKRKEKEEKAAHPVEGDEDDGEWITKDNIEEYKNKNLIGVDEKWDTENTPTNTNEENLDDTKASDNNNTDISTTNTITISTSTSSLNTQQNTSSNRKVGCITTDFSMQNVLLHMGLNLVSVDGRRIRHLTRFVNRCYACSTLVPDPKRIFCPNCGNDTLKKVSCVINDKGEAKFYYNPKRRINLRGSKYMIPMPKGGRNSRDPILREDQLALYKAGKPHKSKLTLGRDKSAQMHSVDVFLPEYTFEGSFGKGSNKGQPYERFNRVWNGYGRRNPNESVKKSKKNKHNKMTMTKHSTRLLLMMMIVVILSLFLVASCQENTDRKQEEDIVVLDENNVPVDKKYKQFINTEAADKPFHDQKDMARIETCIGPCLSNYPGARDFIMKQSFSYSGLQTMFVGDYPELVIYDGSGLVTQRYDLRELSVEDIEKLMEKHGLTKVKS